MALISHKGKLTQKWDGADSHGNADTSKHWSLGHLEEVQYSSMAIASSWSHGKGGARAIWGRVFHYGDRHGWSFFYVCMFGERWECNIFKLRILENIR